MRKLVTFALLLVLLTIGGVIYNIRQAQKLAQPKALLVLVGSAQDHSWNETHVRGMTMAAGKLGVELTVRESVPLDERSLSVMEEAIAGGVKYVFCTSVGFEKWTKAMADKYPEVRFFQCAGTLQGRNYLTYFGRIYQMRYLAGIVAGMESKTGRIGYVASFPLTEVKRGINAFALGVRRVNPAAQIYVSWTGTWGEDDKTVKATLQLLDEHKVDLLTMHSDSQMPLLLAEQRGIKTIGYNQANPDLLPQSYLTAAAFHWEAAYEKFLRMAMQNVFVPGNYWDGLETGIVELGEMSGKVSAATINRTVLEREKLMQRSQDVFNGPIYDNRGVLRVPPDETISDKYLLNDMNWYAEGVVADE